MFDARSFPVIEGGGTYPSIKYREDGIGVVDPNRVYEAMINYRKSNARDLNKRKKVAWYENGKDMADELLTVFGVESASNRTKDGEILNIGNVPYNAHAEYNVPGSGESYGIMQIDVSGDNKTYVMMAMDKKYAEEIDKATTVTERNEIGARLFEENRDEAIGFLKDINNIDKHMIIAGTIFNDNGMDGWKAYNNYKNGNDQGFKDLYETVQRANEQRVYSTWDQDLMRENRKNTADMLRILEMRGKMPVNIEDRAKTLIDAYTTLKRDNADMTDFADSKIEKLKPFAGIYGS
jgi:hypothetical protein